MSLKLGIGAGIGLFLGLIGLHEMGRGRRQSRDAGDAGPPRQPGTALACLGFLIIAGLTARGMPGAILIGILVTAALGAAARPDRSFTASSRPPPSLAPTFLQLDIRGALSLGVTTVVLTFFLVDVLDNAGTLIATTQRAGLMRPDGTMARLREALLADSGGAIRRRVAGDQHDHQLHRERRRHPGGRPHRPDRGGRGRAVPADPVLRAAGHRIPAFATAPALVFVACLMTRALRDIDWDDATEYVPAVVLAHRHPVHLLDRCGDRPWLHRLRRGEGGAGRIGAIAGAAWLIAGLPAEVRRSATRSISVRGPPRDDATSQPAEVNRVIAAAQSVALCQSPA